MPVETFDVTSVSWQLRAAVTSTSPAHPIRLEGEHADAAEKLVRRANRKHQRVKTERPEPAAIPPVVAKLPDPPSPVRTPAS